MQNDKFNFEFTALHQTIEDKLNRIKSKECQDAKVELDECLELFNRLKEKLDLKGTDLPQYVRKTSQERINQLSQLINETKNVIQPKKEFKFNAKIRPKRVVKSSGDKSNAEVEVSECENVSSFGLKDKCNENLELDREQVNSRDIQVCNLSNCIVNVFGNPSTVHIINCKNSQINTGPVSTSIFIDKCSDCLFQVFCQQLRVHNTYDSTFNLHVCTSGIIEDSSRLKFGTYQLVYDHLDDDVERSKLNRSINNWNKIEDFNWLVKNKQSPNWTVL